MKKKPMRSRKQQNLDRKNNLAEMAERVPAESAVKQMAHQAYKPYTVDDYLEKLGVDTKGEIAGGQKHFD